MKLSACNKLKRTIAAEESRLAAGQIAYAVIKASNAMVAVD
jgi:molybdopterin-binding protein